MAQKAPLPESERVMIFIPFFLLKTETTAFTLPFLSGGNWMKSPTYISDSRGLIGFEGFLRSLN